MWSEFFGRQPWCTSRVVDVSWPKKMEEMDKFIIRAPWMENMSPFSAGCGGQWWQSDRSNSWKRQSTWHHLCEIVFVMSFLGSSRNNFFLQGIEGFYVIYACSLSFGTSSVNRIPYTAPLWIYWLRIAPLGKTHSQVGTDLTTTKCATGSPVLDCLLIVAKDSQGVCYLIYFNIYISLKGIVWWHQLFVQIFQ